MTDPKDFQRLSKTFQRPLLFLGEDAAGARRRVSAVAEDAGDLIILPCWGIAAALALGVVARKYAAGARAALGIDLRLSDIAWVVIAGYFALRAVSAGYVHTAAFARLGKGLFDRPWINWLVRNLGQFARRQGSD